MMHFGRALAATSEAMGLWGNGATRDPLSAKKNSYRILTGLRDCFASFINLCFIERFGHTWQDCYRTFLAFYESDVVYDRLTTLAPHNQSHPLILDNLSGRSGLIRNLAMAAIVAVE
jgi:hypothetical protein